MFIDIKFYDNTLQTSENVALTLDTYNGVNGHSQGFVLSRRHENDAHLLTLALLIMHGATIINGQF